MLLRAPKSAKVCEALQGEKYYQCYPEATLSQQKETKPYDDTKIITILFIRAGQSFSNQGVFIPWNQLESYRLMARQCWEEKGLEKMFFTSPKMWNTFSLITVKSELSNKSSWL